MSEHFWNYFEPLLTSDGSFDDENNNRRDVYVLRIAKFHPQVLIDLAKREKRHNPLQYKIGSVEELLINKCM